jgi:hypothetical protein
VRAQAVRRRDHAIELGAFAIERQQVVARRSLEDPSGNRQREHGLPSDAPASNALLRRRHEPVISGDARCKQPRHEPEHVLILARPGDADMWMRNEHVSFGKAHEAPCGVDDHVGTCADGEPCRFSPSDPYVRSRIRQVEDRSHRELEAITLTRLGHVEAVSLRELRHRLVPASCPPLREEHQPCTRRPASRMHELSERGPAACLHAAEQTLVARRAPHRHLPDQRIARSDLCLPYDTHLARVEAERPHARALRLRADRGRLVEEQRRVDAQRRSLERRRRTVDQHCRGQARAPVEEHLAQVGEVGHGVERHR